MKRVTLKKREMSYAMTEELNTLRTNIQFSGVDKKVIVMTSSFSGEGKSTITYQLAKSLAELGKRVLLIDADMRKSVMVNMLESGSVDKGLSHYLSGQCSLSEAVYATESSRLHILFAGPVPPNPTELLSGELFKDTLNSFRDIYDYIFIDCAPVGMVIDAAIVAKCSDAAIMMIESGAVKRKLALEAKEKLETAEGIEFIKQAGADDAVLTLKSLEAFAKAADGRATKIIIPSELQGIAGLTKTIAEVARPDKAAE